jgi:hypothetical protein
MRQGYQNDAKNVPKERRLGNVCTNLTNFVPKYTNKGKIGKMAAILLGGSEVSGNQSDV